MPPYPSPIRPGPVHLFTTEMFRENGFSRTKKCTGDCHSITERGGGIPPFYKIIRGRKAPYPEPDGWGVDPGSKRKNAPNAVTTFISHAILMFGETLPCQMLSDATSIIGWVAMWAPATVLLLELWPVLETKKIYEKISGSEIVIVPRA